MGDRKHHQKEWLEEQVKAGKSTKQIADENRISYRLVELYLTKHGIAFTPKNVNQ